ncbi:D-alanyl-D-alanine carboxypeptidase/D-alanyl-D-alanine-endopeptidase [Sphingobacterium sp. JB170]|uniref:D-alanyl-D-alanine carboxypeptidase/D-alanyl-D-alanine-endopeptidase n=1 Tax=Sphingobacterium sp. JB170 TaxID=1434842 RepID=UPI00097E9E0B|nr:D-alanyl-D-alanine carboxypeptidase [Sphingobacterium sp. JB170]SJN35784.1 D-alanyl-D-alanine carboxypeptidase [Sphingobacterium sp. JB170]
MKQIYLFFALICICRSYSSAQSLNPDPIRVEFENAKKLRDYFYGFSLYDLDSNRFIMGINEDKHFAPASNTKVFTLFTVLKTLGDSIPGIHYVEKGDSLIFWGTGDPTFLHNRLDTKKVFDFLKGTPKKLYFIEPAPTQEPFYRNGWSIEDYNEYYQPEISTFPIYGNVVTFRASADRLLATPAEFQQNLSLVSDTTAKFSIMRNFENNLFTYNHTYIPRNYVNEKPFRYSNELMVKLLSDSLHREVTIIGQPASIKDVKTIYSARTVDILRQMMLPSDNFLAEQFQMLAAREKFGSFQTQRLRTYFQDEYFDLFSDKIQLYDGSGLSTYNKVTPRSMIEVLLLINEMVSNRNELEYLFPVGGVSGTLKTAYKLDQGQPFVWAKTGTINGVHNQSGFIRTRTGRNLVFSFMNTNYLGSSTPVRREIVKIVTFIRENY